MHVQACVCVCMCFETSSLIADGLTSISLTKSRFVWPRLFRTCSFSSTCYRDSFWGSHCLSSPFSGLGFSLTTSCPPTPCLGSRKTLTQSWRNNLPGMDQSQCVNISVLLHCHLNIYPSLILPTSQSRAKHRPFCEAICFGARKHFLILSLLWISFDHTWT